MSGFRALVRFVSLRHLFTRPVRSTLTLLGVAFGVALVIGMRATNESVLDAFDQLSDRAAGKADLEIVGDEAGIDMSLLEVLDDHREVAKHFAGRIEQTSYLKGNGGKPGLRVLVLGVDFFGDLDFLPFKTAKGPDVFGDAISFVNTPGAVLISETLARDQGLDVGSAMWLRTGEGLREFKVWSVLADDGKARAFGGQVLILNLDAAQVGFVRGTNIDRIDVELAPGLTRDEGRARLQALIGDKARVETPSKRADQLARMTSSFRYGMQMSGSIAVLIGMFLIYNAVAVSVTERRREIGILRSVGVSRGRVAGVFLAEAAVIGLVGSAFGVVLGRVLATQIVGEFAPTVSRLFENINAPRVTVSRNLTLFGLALGLFATLGAAWLPSREAAHLQPVETLRRDLHATGVRRRSMRGLVALSALGFGLAAALSQVQHLSAGFGAGILVFLAGVALTPAVVSLLTPVAAQLALRVVGPSARLGVENVTRELARSSISVGALMLAACLSVTLSSYTHSYEKSCLEWIEQAIPADMLVHAGSPTIDRESVAYSPEWRSWVDAVPGVEGTNLIRSLSIPWEDLRLEVLSLESYDYFRRMETSEYRRILDGPFPTPRDALVKEPAVLVSENLAWKKRLKPGDTITLPSPTGPHPFTIHAIAVDYSTDQGWLMMDRRWTLEYWGQEAIEGMHVYVKPGEDVDAVASRVRAALAEVAGDDGGLFVTTARVFKEEIRHIIRQTFAISKASEVVALVVAVFGVVGTMLAGVLARTREIGVLRAIGAKRHQVVASVVAESAWLGFCAALTGALVAVPASLVFVHVIGVQASGWHVPFHYPWLAALRMTVSVIALAAAAGFVPGLRAARLVVQDALAYE
ncbi:MAG: FtsX-like permease family protein [Deltaproteobacteria bacterium]|nr:FtsX-like permease family protein [Deltaproteobacteria bacterium]